MSSIERNEKELTVNGKPLVIKELSINEMYDNAEFIMNFVGMWQEGKLNLAFARETLLKVGPAFTDWEGKDFLDLTPSQMKALFPYFKEVNNDFLQILDSFGFIRKLKEIKELAILAIEKRPLDQENQEKDTVSQENESN